MKELGIFILVIGVIVGSLYLNTWTNKNFPSNCPDDKMSLLIGK